MSSRISRLLSSRTVGRALSAIALLTIPIVSVTGHVSLAADADPELLQITFTPHLTPINFTVTPEPTVPSSLEARDLAAEGSGAEEDDSELDISGGDWYVGYDIVQTPNGPQWHLWLNGEVVIVEANDPAATSLISAFMIQADNRARALSDFNSADANEDIAYAGAGAGAVSLMGGTVTAIVGCAGVPFTFWAAGGTGWACAGGIVAGIGGAGALIGSAISIFQSGRDKDDAQASYDTANRVAGELFRTIKQVSNSP